MTTLETMHNTLAAIVAIVDQQGELRGRVRLQKLSYLLQQRGFGPLRDTWFSGPHSEHLAGALDQAVASGLVEEDRWDSADGFKLYAYKLNREHPDFDYLALPPDDADAVRSFMKVSKGAHWRTLELAATVIHLEGKLKISREAATTRAIGLKPACEPYRADAAALLNELHL